MDKKSGLFRMGGKKCRKTAISETHVQKNIKELWKNVKTKTFIDKKRRKINN